MDNILERIKALCAERGISIRKLEQECGLAPRYVYKWATATPGIDKVAKIADYFGITTDELIGREVPDQDADTELMVALERAFNERPEMRTLFSLAENATPEDVEKAIKIIEALQSD